MVCGIALKLQADFNTSGINIFLGGFGIEHEMLNIVPSKRVYVEELLKDASDAVVLEIAQELGLDFRINLSSLIRN